MKLNEKLKMINRKKFFTSIGIGALGLMLFSFSPVKYILKKETRTKLKVSANPDAVKRQSKGANNV